MLGDKMIKPSNQEMERTYQGYLETIRQMNVKDIAPRLGLEPSTKDRYNFCLFNSRYYYCKNGFFTVDNQKPKFDICIILSKYLMLCPQTEPTDSQLVSFKDFKNSGPLTVYFSTEVEQLICKSFGGKLDQLRQACHAIGGKPAIIEADYDLIMHFTALPRIPIVLLFNDKDDEFEAQAKLLFEFSAESYLDAECLAILGNLLFQFLFRAFHEGGHHS